MAGESGETETDEGETGADASDRLRHTTTDEVETGADASELSH